MYVCLPVCPSARPPARPTARPCARHPPEILVQNSVVSRKSLPESL